MNFNAYLTQQFGCKNVETMFCFWFVCKIFEFEIYR